MNEALAREGIRFERRGSGAVLWVGNEAVKASSAGRDCSLSALQKRFGELTTDLEPKVQAFAAHAPQPVDRAPAQWGMYAEERARHHEERRARREGLRDRKRDEWRRMADRHRLERDDIFKGSWRGRGDLLNATRSQLAARQAQEKAELRDQQRLDGHGHSGSKSDSRASRTGSPSAIPIWRSGGATGSASGPRLRVQRSSHRRRATSAPS
jgi:hypothetical protein